MTSPLPLRFVALPVALRSVPHGVILDLSGPVPMVRAPSGYRIKGKAGKDWGNDQDIYGVYAAHALAEALADRLGLKLTIQGLPEAKEPSEACLKMRKRRAIERGEDGEEEG